MVEFGVVSLETRPADVEVAAEAVASVMALVDVLPLRLADPPLLQVVEHVTVALKRKVRPEGEAKYYSIWLG